MGLIMKGFGHAVPRFGKLVSNEDIIRMIREASEKPGVDPVIVNKLDAEWYKTRVGVEERNLAESGTKQTPDMAARAAKQAILDWQARTRAPIRNIRRINEIYVATVTPDRLGIPSTAHMVQAALQKTGVVNSVHTAYDINLGCCGFLQALQNAHNSGFAHGEEGRTFLIIGSEQLSKIINYADPTTAGIFGDGAGAVVAEWTNDTGKGILDSFSFADDNPGVLTTENNFLVMDGSAVYEFAIKEGSSAIDILLKRNNLRVSDIQQFIFHQGNDRIRRSIAHKLNAAPDRFYSNIARYGNTSAASIPICLSEASRQGLLQEGSLIVLEAFGAGLSLIAMLMRV